MLVKMCPLAEGFPTEATVARSLSSAKSLVLSERRDGAEGFAAPSTFVGLLARVDPQVLCEGRMLTEAFPTFPRYGFSDAA